MWNVKCGMWNYELPIGNEELTSLSFLNNPPPFQGRLGGSYINEKKNTEQNSREQMDFTFCSRLRHFNSLGRRTVKQGNMDVNHMCVSCHFTYG